MFGRIPFHQVLISLVIYLFISTGVCTYFSIKSKKERARFALEMQQIENRIKQDHILRK